MSREYLFFNFLFVFINYYFPYFLAIKFLLQEFKQFLEELLLFFTILFFNPILLFFSLKLNPRRFFTYFKH